MTLQIHESIYKKLNYFYETNKIPHIIFHGSSGSGKRTIVDNFLNKIYQNDHKKIKSNVMMVNCAHGKGIKFIREELKFFAKTNVQSNNGVFFKTIVLINADNLTIDAQSALRRCIELFSANTRFFIIVENKHKLLNPILSRFCEIYVPEHIVDGKIVNLHKYALQKNMNIEKIENELMQEFYEKMNEITSGDCSYSDMVDIVSDFYDSGYSCLDIMKWVENTDNISELVKTQIFICFDKIKSEYRCEKLLMLYILNYYYVSQKK